jgi:hypothetical protein
LISSAASKVGVVVLRAALGRWSPRRCCSSNCAHAASTIQEAAAGGTGGDLRPASRAPPGVGEASVDEIEQFNISARSLRRAVEASA